MKSVFYLFCFIAGIAVALFFKGCNGCSGGNAKVDTIYHKIDTQWISGKKDTVYQLTPYAVYYTKEKVLHDTLETFETIPVLIDTARILEQYFATRFYSDTQSIKYGTVIINDTITQNRITGRSLHENTNLPIIKETTVLSQPKRTVGYIGLSAMGNQGSFLYAIGATFGLKFKNDKYAGIMAMLTKDGQPAYGIELKLPIRFRKQ